MERVHQVLHDIGALVQVESEFKYRCIRMQQKRPEGFGGYLSSTPPSSAAVSIGRIYISLVGLIFSRCSGDQRKMPVTRSASL